MQRANIGGVLVTVNRENKTKAYPVYAQPEGARPTQP